MPVRVIPSITPPLFFWLPFRPKPLPYELEPAKANQTGAISCPANLYLSCTRTRGTLGRLRFRPSVVESLCTLAQAPVQTGWLSPTEIQLVYLHCVRRYRVAETSSQYSERLMPLRSAAPERSLRTSYWRLSGRKLHRLRADPSGQAPKQLYAQAPGTADTAKPDLRPPSST